MNLLRLVIIKIVLRFGFIILNVGFIDVDGLLGTAYLLFLILYIYYFIVDYLIIYMFLILISEKIIYFDNCNIL